MDTEHLIDFLAGITSLSPGFIADLNAGVTLQRYPAKQILKGEGQIENQFWYLKSGLARTYIFDDDRQQHTIRFWSAGEVIFSYAGFLREPSPEFVEVLTESELYVLSYGALQELMNNYPETLKIVGAINRHHIQKDYKRDHLHSLRGKERYLQFKAENANIFKSVPLWMIASYLHMTRENLSRIISEE